jgi:hypothetical protein
MPVPFRGRGGCRRYRWAIAGPPPGYYSYMPAPVAYSGYDGLSRAGCPGAIGRIILSTINGQWLAINAWLGP